MAMTLVTHLQRYGRTASIWNYHFTTLLFTTEGLIYKVYCCLYVKQPLTGVVVGGIVCSHFIISMPPDKESILLQLEEHKHVVPPPLTWRPWKLHWTFLNVCLFASFVITGFIKTYSS
jgi:hypothetical protein